MDTIQTPNLNMEVRILQPMPLIKTYNYACSCNEIEDSLLDELRRVITNKIITMGYLIIAVFVVRVLIAALPNVSQWAEQLFARLKQRMIKHRNTTIFYGNYIEVKAFYVQEFKKAPCISFVNNVDVTKAFEFVKQGNAGRVLTTYQRNYFNWQRQRQEFSRTIFKLENKVMIELGDEWVEILFANNNFDYANKLVEVFKEFKAPEKEDEYEINIITLTTNGLDLKQLDIKPTDLDLDLYYNDDFKAVDKVIKERLAKENDKGIVLLHGLPGTGKTTYLRHLIGSMEKKVLFVSPGVAGNLMNPEFIDLLIDNPNAVLVIEDAENIIMDRKYSSNSSVSNLLNISDGLLSDCLNVQIICTFNSALSFVDSALMRKGRLIAKYEFAKLDVVKAQRLSNHLGLQQKIDKPMTLAEITNPEETFNKPEIVKVIGFRRMEELMEN
jgi:hypothetical protein